MAVHDIFHRAGISEATRIAQIAVHRDLQAHVLSQTGVAQATQTARQLPPTNRTSRFRRDSERRPELNPSASPARTAPRDPQEPGPHLDLLA
jgi:hypothetical protein